MEPVLFGFMFQLAENFTSQESQDQSSPAFLNQNRRAHHCECLASSRLPVRKDAHVEAVQNGHHHGRRVRENLRLVSFRVKDPVKLEHLFVALAGPSPDQEFVLPLDIKVDDVGLSGGNFGRGKGTASAEDPDVAYNGGRSITEG